MTEWIDLTTWTDGDTPSAFQFNSQFKNNLRYLYENATSHFGKFRTYINWPSLDGFTTSIAAGGVIAPQGANVKLSTPSASTGTVYLRSTGSFGTAFVETGKIISVEFSFNGCSAITAQTVKLVLTASTTAPTEDTASHIGFKIVNADVSSISGDAVTGENADTGIDIVAGSALKRLRMVFTPGTNCLFYVDDILKATHVTNLPAAGDDLYLALMITNSANALKEVTAGRVLIERNY